MSQTRPCVLVVDDETDICELIAMTLAKMQIDTICVHSVAQAKEKLHAHSFDCCLTDMALPDGEGIELIEVIQSLGLGIPTAVITAYGNVDGAVNSLKAGAFDYVSKPVDISVLRRLVETALKCSPSSAASLPACSHRLLGESAVIIELNTLIAKVARSQAPVHITGASGTGKERVARCIHANSPRADQAFVPVNCGAIPRELLESEFFGYKKGSFTGAQQDRPGLFQAAAGGTLFLDEVAELPLDMQAKLLRAIQERAVRPVGSQEEVAVDVRLLSATHQDLVAMVAAKQFREDLFYRINVITLAVPTLAERGQDVLLLADYFLTQCGKLSDTNKRQLSPAASQALLHYHFPGNVRELENILERAVALSDDEVIDVTDLSLPCHARLPATCDEVMASQVNALASEKTPLLDSHSIKCGAESQVTTLPGLLDQVERQTILRALEKNHWNKTKTAKSLGISFRALRYRLSKLDLLDEENESS